MAEDINKRIDQYVAIRDKLKALDEAHKLNKQPLVEIQEMLVGRITAFMEANNITDNLKTNAGTCYLSTKYTTSLQDAALFMKYVIDNQQFDLLDRRANSTAVRAFVAQNKVLPPGCNLSAIQTLGVRRGAKQSDDE